MEDSLELPPNCKVSDIFKIIYFNLVREKVVHEDQYNEIVWVEGNVFL